MCFKKVIKEQRLNVALCLLSFVFCLLSSSFVFADTQTTGIMLTPTGNIKKQRAGFGGSIGFLYYIGDIIRKEEKETGYLNPIKSFYFFTDLKASPLKGIAMGGKGFLVLQGSQPEGEYKIGGGGEIGTGTRVFGFLYLTGSKNIGKNMVSLGVLYGPIQRIFNPLIHNYDMEIKEEDLAYFASLNTNIFKRDFGIEAIKPAGYNYILLNTSIEKFFGFSFSFLHSNNISSLIGYFGIRLDVF